MSAFCRFAMRAILALLTPGFLALALAGGLAGPAQAEDCDLSYTDQSCSELPCPTGGFREVPCPVAGKDSPFPNAPSYVCHPYPQARPPASKQCTRKVSENHFFTQVNTGEGVMEPSNPFDYETFPGTNLLPNIYTNVFDGTGQEMPNTLPSTPYVPYNLHDGDPVISEIDHRSPLDDLGSIFTSILEGRIAQVIELSENDAGRSWDAHQTEANLRREAIREEVRSALDILEGEPVPYRVYSGLPVLHYTGPEKVKQVVPIRDEAGNIVGGNVDVHQIWYWQHIESDTAYIDPTPILGEDPNHPLDVEWTITYTLDVLNRGHDDFSPFVTYTDFLPQGGGAAPNKPPNVGMDQSFFNMEEGTRTVLKIKMTYAKYLNLVYTWGWRMHPPRIQVMENAIKTIGEKPLLETPNLVTCPKGYAGCTLPQLEQRVFCEQPASYGPDSPCPPKNACTAVRCKPGQARFDEYGNPTACERAKLYAISRIGDFSPAKRMWNTLQTALELAEKGEYRRLQRIVREKTIPAFLAWQDRTHMPCFERDGDGRCVDPCLDGPAGERCRKGLEADPESDITVLYVNNTMYGQLVNRKNENPERRAGGWVRWPDWETRYDEWKTEHDAWQKAFAQWRKDLAKWERGPRLTAAPQRPREPVGPPLLHVTAYNSDTWHHSYTIADFGGSRGWENQFKSSVKVAGSGCWFTFGRVYWWMPAGAPNGFLCVPPAPTADGKPGLHQFQVQFNFEPSRRLRFYQFDPMHHDVAIYSIH